MPINYGYGVKLDKIDYAADMAQEWRNSEKIYATCRQHDLISNAQQEKWLQRIESDPSIRMYSIWERERGTVGVCGFTSLNHVHQTAEYSLYIAPQYQGHRLSEPALRTLVAHGFRNLNLHVIWGEIFENNEASLHVAAKVGFQVEGHHKERYWKDGRRINTISVSLVRRDSTEKAGR